MDEEIKVRRQRRRRRPERNSAKNDIQATIENVEQTIKAHAAQSSKQLIRKDTFTIQKFEDASRGEEIIPKDTERSWNDSNESKNLTYSINKESEEFGIHNSQNLDSIRDKNEFHPVPAPRKRLKNITEREKMSSDTDRDVTEIDLDDLRSKSTKTDSISPLSDEKSASASDSHPLPVPKPRKIVNTNQKDSETENSKAAFAFDENLHKNTSPSDPNTDNERSESNEIPLVKNLLEEAHRAKQNPKKRNFIGDFFKQTKQVRKRKSFGSVTKQENKKIPRISALLKDLKESEKVTKTEEKDEEGKGEFQEDSLHYLEPVQNKHFYVQSKHGFHMMEKEEVLKNGEVKMENGEKSGKMEDSTVRTAILFQNYWSRSMISFHGILAGFALGHAATVTATMLQYNYEPQAFVGVYSCLSLKIHYVFYALTALCIVSCFDRLDLGHINRKHLQVAWKAPSMWMILCFYLTSFGLSFSNHTAEVRFDSLTRVNHTNVWWGSEDQVSLLQWYHTVWARNVLVLLAWLMISLTKFPDYLHAHLINMAKFFDVKNDVGSLHRLPG